MLNGKCLGFIGGGNMAEAMIRGLLKAQLLGPQEILASDVTAERLTYLQQTFGIRTSRDNAEVAGKADIVLFAVKPQIMSPVLDGLLDVITEEKLLISIAAGISTRLIAEKFPGKVRVVRVMPNTPALVLEGASALCAGAHATADDLALGRTIFEAVGRAVVLDETAMDAVTGLSGSGPASCRRTPSPRRTSCRIASASSASSSASPPRPTTRPWSPRRTWCCWP